MNTKRISGLFIVLFLLAALSGTTVVMAQGPEPPAKRLLPVVAAPGESAAPAFNVYESEPNNTMGQADVMSVNDVMAGDMNYSGDVDFFKFYIHEDNTAILVDTDSLSSDMDSVVYLYNSAGSVIASSDNADETESMLYVNLNPGWWYIKVSDSYGGYGDFTYYDLIVSTPLLISAAAANLGMGNVAGIPFESQDILAWSGLNDGAEKWVMLIDGSDVGFTKNVMNLSRTRSWGTHVSALAVGFSANVTIGGALVKPWDFLNFRIDRAGPTTVISAFDRDEGANMFLTTVSEKMDALSIVDYAYASPWSERWYMSTVGTASIPTTGGIRKPADEDIFNVTCNATSTVANTFFDGSRVAGLAMEDVYAASYYEPYNDMYLTILGTGRIDGHPVTQKDIFRIDLPGHTWGSLVWHGPDHGWNYNIDAFDYPGGW